MKNIWQKNWVWLTALMIGLAGALVIGSMGKVNTIGVQQGIAEEIIRFHVLANSNSEEDQQLKMQVKETVVSYLQQLLEDSDSVADSRAVLEEHLGDIEESAEQQIQQSGYQYPVQAVLTKAYFPVKTYGDCTFPAGDYEALQVRIGEARGRNWWCVVYPSLCFTDAIQGVVSEENKEKLKNLLTEEEYQSILDGGKVKVRFKWLPER